MCLSMLASAAAQEPVHAISMHGEPALSPGFTHLPYANPDAPKGGSITYGVIGTFDSLNPFILKSMRTTARGIWDPEFGKLVFEPLMTRSADEPFTLYGLLAKSVTMPDDRSWMEFELDERAKWADGLPVTPQDVIFTYEVLTEHGRPPFNARMKKIAAIEQTGERKVKFTFNDQSDREFPLIVAGFMPVLPKHATNAGEFGDSTLEPPVGSGPYRVSTVEPGQRIQYERRDDYWGADLPANRGFNNFDTITVDYYRSVQTRFEAFKKGLIDVYTEGDPAEWQRAYDFPAVTEGRVKKQEFRTGTPANMMGFVFNTRRPVFADRKVREGLSMLFDFEWANRSLYFGAYERTASYWDGSELASTGRPADERERALLAPWPEAVSPEIMEGQWRPPVSDGSGRDRKVLRAALAKLGEAGYSAKGGKLADASGNVLAFEIMTRSESEEKLAIAWKRTLDVLGIDVSIRAVDEAQYQRRVQEFDYDVILTTYAASLSPGAEQEFRWASPSRDIPGSFNFAGVAEPAIDAAISALLNAREREAFTAAVRALDRLLLSGHYVTPLFHLPAQWIAHWDRVTPPEKTPIFGAQYPAWWSTENR